MRLARLVAVAFAGFGALYLVGAGLFGRPDMTPDAMLYYRAAERLIAGGSLYPGTGPGGYEHLPYLYAPWFAVAWIPLALLGPDGLLLWYGVLAAAAAYVVWATFRLKGHAGLVLGILSLPILGAVPGGNAGILVVALLIATRVHPAAVGVAASLKVYPLLFVIGYVAERRWRDAALAIVVAALLWAPAIWFGVDRYATDLGNVGVSVWRWSPAAWLVQDAILLGASATLAVRRSRWTWLAIATAVPLVAPRIFLTGPEYAVAAAWRMTGNDDRAQDPPNRAP